MLQIFNYKNKVLNKAYTIQEAKVETFTKSFTIEGTIKGNYDGEKNEKLTLTLYDNSTNPEKEHKIDCEIVQVPDETYKTYKFRCDPTGSIKGSLYLSKMVDKDNNTLIINNTDSNRDIFEFNIDNGQNSTVPIHRDNYRKTSSGLSGGAIAGIVIACAVVLIIASIVAMMVRKPSVPLDNSSSVVGLRTIDNYSQ